MSGAHAAIAAANRKKKNERDEEEQQTGYTANDLEKWEFKIVRSATKAFRKQEVFYQVLEEEAMVGWELLEKLDDSRIRFKRPTEARKKDHLLPEGINPYRTQIGMTEEMLAVIIMSVVMVFVGLGAFIAYLAKNGLL